MTIGNEEGMLKRNGDVTGSVKRVTLTENLILLARSEVATVVEVESNYMELVGILEPTSTCDGLIVGRTLITTKSNQAPVRLNVYEYDKILKKGTTVGSCEDVVMISKVKGSKEFQQEPRSSTTIKTIFGNITEEFSDARKIAAEQLLMEFEVAFSMNDNDIGWSNIIQHGINAGDHQPIKQAPRTVPLAKQRKVINLLQDMNKQEVIKHSSSPCVSLIVLVKRRVGIRVFVLTAKN